MICRRFLRSAALIGLLATLTTVAAPVARPAQSGRSSHVVYLHGNIVQQQGRNAVSPTFGPYLFDDIVTALGRGGRTVHAPIRTGAPSNEDSARHVAGIVRGLLDAGVPAHEITIVGASQGAIIAMLASDELEHPQLRFVLMGACNDWVREEVKPDLHGHILSIYEAGDPYGASCEALVAGKQGVRSFQELRLETGLSHGFLYRPIAAWIEPVRRWSAGADDPATDRAQRRDD